MAQITAHALAYHAAGQRERSPFGRGRVPPAAEVVRILDGSPRVLMALNEELRKAAGEGQLDKMMAMLGLGARANAPDSHGKTPLMHAVANLCWNATTILISKGACVNDMDNEGKSPLMMAAENGDTKIIRMLIRNRANVNAADKYDWTALMHASRREGTETIRMLIEHGADVNVMGRGMTALMIAAANGNIGTVKLLLAHHAKINARNSDGHTALHSAIHEGQPEMADFLRERGAKE